MTDAVVVSRCIMHYEYGAYKCHAALMSDGTIEGRYCGEPCSFIMKKAGAGSPPFHWRRKLFAGDTELPNQDWQPA